MPHTLCPLPNAGFHPGSLLCSELSWAVFSACNIGPLGSSPFLTQGSCPNWSLQERWFHFAWGHRESVICRTHIPEGVGRKLHGVGSPVPQFDAAGLPQGAAAILSQGGSELASRKGCCIPGPGSASPPASLRAGTGSVEGWNESTPPQGLG